MTGLYLVRSEHVPVEHLQPGDTLVLPSKRQVTVERVDQLDDGRYVVRWWRPAGPDDYRCDEGRYLGSLIPVPAGHRWEITRA